MPAGRTLTDGDVEALAEALSPKVVLALKEEIIQDFYQDLGKGLWASIKKGLFWLVLGLAIYGMVNNHKFLLDVIAATPKGPS